MSGELNPSSVTRPLRVLFVDDCDDDVQLSIRVLEKASYAIHPHVVQTQEQFGRTLDAGDYDLILCDYRLPGWSGGDVLRMVRDSGRELPVVLVTGTLGEETAVEMIKLGAADFVLKQRLSRLPLAIQRAMREKQIREERNRAEQALRRSEREYRHLFESANDVILIMDAETAEILEANPKAQQTYGLLREQLVGRSLKSLTRDVQRCEERIQRLLRKGGCLNFETVHLDAAGRAIHFLGGATLIDYRGHRAILAIQHDITERKRAEERLHLFGRILDSSTEAVAILTAEGHFSEQNAAHQALTEYSIEELRGRTPALLIGEAEFQEHWQAVLTNGPLEQETRIRTKSGREKTVEASVFSITGDAGQVLCIVAITRDISERRRLQVQLQQAAKMEAVGRLAGGVAHDFNNLLNVIIGYSELMLERRNSAEFLERGAREIRKAADRAAGLTRQLLAFSRQQVLEPKVLELSEIIAEMKDLFVRMLGEDVELVVTSAEGLGRVRADPGQIGQVIMNLAANSRDAMPQGGRFLVETSNVLVDAAFAAEHANMPPGPYVLLSVTDTGSGMTPEIRSHIFEPFFTTKEKGKGTGLGLATVYGIVKQSGGYIWAHSEPEQGASFKVYLPRVDALPERLQPAAAAPAANCRGSETLLVVEDEEGVRILVRDYLRMNGYTVLEAGHGEEALRIACEHSGTISLMITDVIMPGMNARELAERMAILRPAMKVLYISGYAETTVYRKGVLEKGAPFLQKPFGPFDLGRKVRDVLGPEREAFLIPSV
jgi:two-component system cell cycle sensor histidine kinase/response regulator CckA